MNWQKIQSSFKEDLLEQKKRSAESFQKAKYDGMQIYLNGYSIRTRSYLEEDFPETLKRLPKALEQKIIHEYSKLPIPSITASDFGEVFSSFLRTQELPQELEFLPDLAALEWAMVEAFFANDMPAFDVNRLSTLGEFGLLRSRFIFDSSLQILESHWPLWEILEGEAYEKRTHKLYFAVYKETGEALFRELEPIEARVLKRLYLGQTLADLKGETLDPSLFTQWVASGLLRDIRSS